MAVKEDEVTKRDYRKRAELGRILVKEEVQARIKLVNNIFTYKVTNILKKVESDWTTDDRRLLAQSPEIVCQVSRRLEKRDAIKERAKEVEDRESVLREKCAKLADAIRQAKSVVVYTGAGISTAASIPDYRGPNGVWTLLQKGVPLSMHNLSEAEPTITHMALAELRRKQWIAHVVSQNCDGLHLRSGLARTSLSEVHGNMFIEVCKSCKPHREYVRLFDVTERTSLHRHKTGRQCDICGHELIDTIVHFGERGTLKSPLNWTKAIAAAKKCDLILCIGSSLKVLRKYSCLWGTSRPLQERPMLFIVNLQWTPKDHMATLKINGQCDKVMLKVMQRLEIEIPSYARQNDPLFRMATPLRPSSEADIDVSKDVPMICDLKVDDDGGPSSSSLSSLDVDRVTGGGHHCKEDKQLGLKVEVCCDVHDAKSARDAACNKEESEEPKTETLPEATGVTANESDESKDGDGSVSANNSSYGWFGKGYRKNMKRRKRH